jgi:hypothetical protein
MSRGVRGVDWELTPPPDDGRPEAVVGWIGAVAFVIALVAWLLVLALLWGWR